MSTEKGLSVYVRDTDLLNVIKIKAHKIPNKTSRMYAHRRCARVCIGFKIYLTPFKRTNTFHNPCLLFRTKYTLTKDLNIYGKTLELLEISQNIHKKYTCLIMFI